MRNGRARVKGTGASWVWKDTAGTHSRMWSTSLSVWKVGPGPGEQKLGYRQCEMPHHGGFQGTEERGEERAFQRNASRWWSHIAGGWGKGWLEKAKSLLSACTSKNAKPRCAAKAREDPLQAEGQSSGSSRNHPSIILAPWGV